MTSPRSVSEVLHPRRLAELRLRRSRAWALGGVAFLAAGLTVAVAQSVPGRHAAKVIPLPDPVTEPLFPLRPDHALPPESAGVPPGATTAAPVALSGPS